MNIKKQIAYPILFVIFALVVWLMWSIITLVIIRYTGTEITAVVDKLPVVCNGDSKMTVLLDGKLRNVDISEEDCSKGIYKAGQPVRLIAHDKFDKLVWPNSHPEAAVLIVSGILLLVFYQVKKRVRIQP